MNIPDWSRAWPPIRWQAQLKTFPEDFIVNEVLSFPFQENQGEHLYLQIKKCWLTTQQVVKAVADYFDVKQEFVGYAGLKDKHGLTTQWFSVYLAGKANNIDCEMLQRSKLIRASSESIAECQILSLCWHSAKLRKGAILKNKFQILLRSEQPVPDQIEQRLRQIASTGFPNYFGDQRFGWNGNNIETTGHWFENKIHPKKSQQGMLLSTARSFLFNHILQSRIDNQSWNRALQGDCFILQGSRKYFSSDALTDEILQRCEDGDIHPSGVLWGRGTSALCAVAEKQQQQALKDFSLWCQALENKGVNSAQRALRCMPQDLCWEIVDKTNLKLSFALPSGCFATSLLRELTDKLNSYNSTDDSRLNYSPNSYST